LNPRLELILWGHGSAEVEAIPNCKDGFELKILAPVEILNQTETVGVLITPRTGSTRSVLERTNGLVPLPEVWGVVTLEIVS
jgi:hypothetical protein